MVFRHVRLYNEEVEVEWYIQGVPDYFGLASRGAIGSFPSEAELPCFRNHAGYCAPRSFMLGNLVATAVLALCIADEFAPI